MQLSALNSIIAAQQARGQTPAKPAAAPAAADVGKPSETGTAQDFAPISFGKSVAAPAQAASPPSNYAANAPLGSRIDIRV
jgi:hypothetical protein